VEAPVVAYGSKATENKLPRSQHPHPWHGQLLASKLPVFFSSITWLDQQSCDKGSRELGSSLIILTDTRRLVQEAIQGCGVTDTALRRDGSSPS